MNEILTSLIGLAAVGLVFTLLHWIGEWAYRLLPIDRDAAPIAFGFALSVATAICLTFTYAVGDVIVRLFT